MQVPGEPPPEPQIPGHMDDLPENAVEIIELLLEYGADAAVREKYGQTALFLYLGTLLEQSVNAGIPTTWLRRTRELSNCCCRKVSG